MAYAGGLPPALKVESSHPPVLSVLDQGVSYGLSLPTAFMTEVEGVYDEVHIEDLTGDGIGEVIFRLGGEGVNSCSKILYYNSSDRSLKELVFKRGGLCNFKVQNGYVISSYRDGAIWVEDIYIVNDGRADIHISDWCVGCGEVRRVEYRWDGSSIGYLVSDNVGFEKRAPLVSKVISSQAKIFSTPGAAHSTKKYLIRGDRITFLGFENVLGEDWAEFRFLGEKTTTVGWLRCRDLSGCSKF
jgi:hypothetical protein